MNQRISAGVILVKNDSILMVNHKKPGHYDFWVAPGGGVLGVEDIEASADRELIVSVEFIQQSELRELTVFPPIILDQLWDI